MNRTSIFTALRSAVEPLGYSFATGDPTAATALIRNYPAAWLDTPVAVAVEGLDEGTISYRISLRLLHRADRDAILCPETVWDSVENDTLVALRTLSLSSGVIALDAIKMTPTALQTTNHGELGIVATFTLKVEHCI